MSKIPLNEEFEVTDGYLSASITGDSAGLRWTDRKRNRKQQILWYVKEMPLVSIAGEVTTGENPLRELMKYRDMLEGVHPVIDKLLQAYDIGFYLNVAYVREIGYCINTLLRNHSPDVLDDDRPLQKVYKI